MKPQHMRIVVTFLQEAMKEAEAEKTAAEDVTHLSLVILSPVISCHLN